MANIKISDMAQGSVTGSSYFEQAKDGVSEQVSAAQIAEYAGATYAHNNLDTVADTLVGAVNEVNGKFGVALTGTLTAGNTTLTLSNAAILTTSTIDIYTDTWGVNPTDVTVSAGSIVLTFDEQENNVAVKVVVK